MKSLSTHWRKVRNFTSYVKSLNVISYHFKYVTNYCSAEEGVSLIAFLHELAGL